MGWQPDTAVLLMAAKAWRRYASVCCWGGTEDERRWAFERALAAEKATWPPALRGVLSAG